MAARPRYGMHRMTRSTSGEPSDPADALAAALPPAWNGRQRFVVLDDLASPRILSGPSEDDLRAAYDAWRGRYLVWTTPRLDGAPRLLNDGGLAGAVTFIPSFWRRPEPST